MPADYYRDLPKQQREYDQSVKCSFCNKMTEFYCDECRKHICEDHSIHGKRERNVHERLFCPECTKKRNIKVEKGCFIGTAAYGTPFAKELDLLRQFRDESLLISWYGSLFVKTYYCFSPFLARIIESHDFLRWIVRSALKPTIKALQRRYKK